MASAAIFRWFSLLLFTGVLATTAFASTGHAQLPKSQRPRGCLTARLCCPGRDSSCAVQSGPVNAILEDPEDKPCYCDHACLKVGDCCHDFKQACGVTDCQVSGWGPWSKCSAECGSGSMVRDRAIVRGPKNGGDPCPDLIQTRGCYGSRCEAKSIAKARREVALLLPGKLSQVRALNESMDIRKNLRLKYPVDPVKEGSKDYCVTFEVTKVRKACEAVDDVRDLLSKGQRVCIGCEGEARRGHLSYRCNGHGVEGKPTRWSLVADPKCHGRWTRLELTDRCGCHQSGRPDFIFV